MGLGFCLVEAFHPPDQPLNGGDPIENLTRNLEREFQLLIVSFDTIFVNIPAKFSQGPIANSKSPVQKPRPCASRNRREKSSA